MARKTYYRTCPLCEATCGLAITCEGRDVVDVRGDAEDHFSEGYICPKGTAIGDFDADPDRIQTPMIREGREWRSVTWDEAFRYINDKLTPILAEHGKNAVAAYLGNPSVHNTELSLYGPALLRGLGTKNIFSASTVDQMPKQVSSALMFGTGLSIPIPDLDRTQYLLVLGANPLVSNGSLMTAANVGERLKRIQRRGGKIVVMDPVRTKTANQADEHHFILPGSDAYFLFGIVHVLFDEALVNLGSVGDYVSGLETIERLATDYSPEAVARRCGVEPDTIRRIARELAAAESAAVYARIGTCVQEFGTLSSWLPDVINILTGNLDRPGGVLFPLPAHGAGNSKGTPGTGKGFRKGRWKSRVSGHDEIFGEIPCTALAEEIETPGEGQVRALITTAANPVLSIPNGPRLSKALESLELMVSIDVYLNETTRHAHVILPDASPLERCHFDIAFAQLSVRNHAKYSAPLFPVRDSQIPSWHIMLKLAAIAMGAGPDMDVAQADDMFIAQAIQRELGSETSPIHGKDPAEILRALAPRTGPQRLIDFMVRTGPYGDGFGTNADGLSLKTLEEHPHGIDLGPLQPRIPEVLRTPSGKIELAPDLLVEDCERLLAGLRDIPAQPLLIGRRHLRSNNSWMHNIPKLVSGKPRCTLLVNTADAERLNLRDGDTAMLKTAQASAHVVVEVTDAIMPGVVSLPHGWGHTYEDTRMRVARAHAGVNTNALIDDTKLDPPSGNAVLNGVPVELTRTTSGGPERAREAVTAK